MNIHHVVVVLYQAFRLVGGAENSIGGGVEVACHCCLCVCCVAFVVVDE